MSLYADIYLQKIAFSPGNNQNPSILEWEKTLDPGKQREQELVRKSQKGDMIALSMLRSLYTNNINKSINDSGLGTAVGFDAAQIIAQEVFKELINDYDPLKGSVGYATFFTYFSSRFTKILINKRNEVRDPLVRQSTTLTANKAHVLAAQKMLRKELGRQPTDFEVAKYIEQFSTGKGIRERDVTRINAYDRTELSGSAFVGGEEAGSAAPMTWGDVSESMDTITQADIPDVQAESFAADKAIERMPKEYHRFIRNIITGRERNLNRAALNNNMTFHEGKRALAMFQDLFTKEKTRI